LFKRGAEIIKDFMSRANKGLFPCEAPHQRITK